MWVDTNKGDSENLEYRCRLVAKEVKKDKWEDLFAANPPLEAKKVLFSFLRELARVTLGFYRRREGLPPRECQEGECMWICRRRINKMGRAVD